MQKFKHCKRYNDPGHAHALTFSCFRRRPFLSKPGSCQWFIDAVNLSREKHRFHLWAYVVMPEHVHMLVWPTEPDYDISRILETVKLSVTRRALDFVRGQAPEFLPQMLDVQPNGKQAYRFWQRGGGYDRNITDPKAVWAEIDYFHANPIRRGLCMRADDWLWSSAADYSGVRCGPLSLDRESLPRILES